MNQPDEAPRGFRMRWWMWGMAIVAVLAASIIAVRLQGFALLQRLDDDLHRCGLPDLTEFMATAPPVDASRQERLARLIRTQGNWGDSPAFLPFHDIPEQRHSASDIAKLQAMLHAGTGTMASVTTLLDEGPVQLSLFGWVERDPTRLADMPPEAIWNNLPSALLAGRIWCNWFGIQACQADDPEPFLCRLDLMHDSLQHPAVLIDAMIGVAIHAIRDQVYTWLSTRGRLSDDRLHSWCSETPPQREWMHQSLAGERLLFAGQIRRMSPIEISQSIDWSMTPGSSPSWGSHAKAVLAYLLLGHETAVGVSSVAALEAASRDLPVPTPTSMPLGLPSQIGANAAASQELLLTAYESAFGHRLFRLMGMCAALYRAGIPLPENTAALATHMPIDLLTAQSDNEPAIVYERLSPSRFRLGLDPATKRPPIVPASRWMTTAGGTYDTTIGRPASTRAYAWNRWSLEIDLDAILIPPPEKPAKKKS